MCPPLVPSSGLDMGCMCAVQMLGNFLRCIWAFYHQESLVSTMSEEVFKTTSCTVQPLWPDVAEDGALLLGT